MKKIVAGFFSLLIILSTFTSNALAATYYCDNDADSSYSCDNILNGDWDRLTGYSGDWHNDSRLASGGDEHAWYGWEWDDTENLEDRTPKVYVWLANPNFTNTRAAYYVGYFYPSQSIRIAYLNQNTANSGWNYLGESPEELYTNWFGLDVLAKDENGNTNTSTGADYIRFVEDTTLLSENVTKIIPDNPDIKDVQEKMLNAIDNFNSVKGSFDIYFSNIKQDQTVEFEVSEGNKPGSYEKITSKNGRVIENKYDGVSLLTLDHNQKSFNKSNVAKVNSQVVPGHFKNEKNESIYILRQDPAWAYTADEVILPQNYAFWLSNPGNKIVGHEEILGRKVTVVEGKHDDFMSKKLQAETYKMWVDTDTGVLLKLEGRNADSEISYSINVTEIKFNELVDESKFNTNAIPSNWIDRSYNKIDLKSS